MILFLYYSTVSLIRTLVNQFKWMLWEWNFHLHMISLKISGYLIREPCLYHQKDPMHEKNGTVRLNLQCIASSAAN